MGHCKNQIRPIASETGQHPPSIIDLAEIAGFPICSKAVCYWPDQSSHPLCHRRISVQSQVAAANGRSRLRSGSLFVVLAPFHLIENQWPFLIFGVARFASWPTLANLFGGCVLRNKRGRFGKS